MQLSVIIFALLAALTVSAVPMDLEERGGNTCNPNSCSYNGKWQSDCSTLHILDLKVGDIINPCSGGCHDGHGYGCKVTGLGILDCTNINVGSILDGLHISHLKRGVVPQGCTVNGLGILDCSSINILDFIGGTCPAPPHTTACHPATTAYVTKWATKTVADHTVTVKATVTAKATVTLNHVATVTVTDLTKVTIKV